MMKAAQQGGGGGGGQHGSLLAGGTALPGGPSPQPGQPGSLMQGGAYRGCLGRGESSCLDRFEWIIHATFEKRLIIIRVYIRVSRIESDHDFYIPFNETENIRFSIGSRIDIRSDSSP